MPTQLSQDNFEAKDIDPKEIMYPNDTELQRPYLETINKITERTRRAVEKIARKIIAAKPVHPAEKLPSAQYIHHMPSQQGGTFNLGTEHRIVQIVERQKDIMEPPRFKISKDPRDYHLLLYQ